jgi:hypothetical protein
MIPSQQREDVVPLCPHCDKVVQVVHFREISALLGKRYVYFCAECRKILGISHRKGFWMG